MTPPASPRVADVRKILIVLLGAIGDVTRALPLLPRLRALYPKARIAWAVEPASHALVETHPDVDDVFLFERPKGFGAFLSFLRTVRNFAPELCLDLQRHAKSGLVTFASGAKVRLGFHRVNSREGNWLVLTHYLPPQRHLSSKLEQFQRFADWLGAPELPVTFGISPTRAEEERVERLLQEVPRPFVVGHQSVIPVALLLVQTLQVLGASVCVLLRVQGICHAQAFSSRRHQLE
jgi:ADP-heptose:LPS heptosyltransferase